jgi:PKD repeat protein
VCYQNPPLLVQFNLCAGSHSAIASSKVIISTLVKNNYSSLQIARNGKIYITRRFADSLDVINNPNVLGTSCNYSPCAIWLGNMASSPTTAIQSNYGLPNFMSNYFEQKPNLAFASNTINCGNYSFTPPVLCAATGYIVNSYKWIFGDALSGNANTSTVTAPQHTFSANGNYTVQLILQFACTSDTVKQVINVTGLPNIGVSGRLSICAKENTSLTANSATSYSWSSGSTNNAAVLSPTTTSIYTVTGSTGACQSKKEVTVTVLPCTALTNEDGNINTKLYPNPSNGNTIFVESEKDVLFEAYDDLGKLILVKQILKGKNEIDIKSLSQGIYLIRLSCDSCKSTIHFVKSE